MSGVDGSRLRHTVQPPILHHHVPQVLRPISNRHFPFTSGGPSVGAVDPRLFPNLYSRIPSASAAAADKETIAAPEAALKQTIKTANHGVENGKGSIKQEIKEEILPFEFDKGGKRPKKPKLPKHRRFVPQAPGSTDDTPSNALALSNSCRYDSSLGLLTKKFINLLQQAEDGTLDLNRAADILDVQKRRIYDITNVLEGVNLIEKNLKNMIRWKGTDISKPKELDDQIARLKVEIESLSKEDHRLDGMIRDMQENLSALSEDEHNQKWFYVTKEDVTSIPRFEDATLIAIKAPHGTSVEVPDPDEATDFAHRRYQILLRSATGPIDCFLISNHEERLEASNQDQHPAAIDCSLWLPEDQDTIGTSGVGEDHSFHHLSSDPTRARECTGGVLKIVPSDADMDADYCLMSDLGVSISDSWS